MHKSFTSSFEKTSGILDGVKNLLKGKLRVEHAVTLNPEQLLQIEKQMDKIPRVKPWHVMVAPLLAGAGASIGSDIMKNVRRHKGVPNESYYGPGR